jgi:tryptophan-rich sensory protein
LQMPRLALLDLALIVGFTLLTMHSLYSNYRNAFYVMLPYTLWILFAFYLNFYIVVNN